MKYFSTFSGIGGFEIGIQNAYRSTVGRSEENTPGEHEEFFKRFFTSTWEDPSSENGRTGERPADIAHERPLCVGYSEIDKYASSVYERNFNGVKNYGDITKINAEELPDFDCLVGGFPCQSFSIAGKRRGFDDTRGTLFFDLARILRAKRPRLFVFENVKGLLSHDNGNTFKTIIATIDELGYDCQWQVLNSKDFGVPQNRERVIIVGHLRGTPRPEVFPIGDSDQEPTREANEQRSASTLTSRSAGGQNRRGNYITKQPCDGHQPGFADPNDTDGRGTYPKIRRLTPIECERLQGFPDNWTANGVDHAKGMFVPISDTQRYKMCGNAVTTNVIQAVFEKILHDGQSIKPGILRKEE